MSPRPPAKPRVNLFSGPDDIYAKHPEIAELLELGAHELRAAHHEEDEGARDERLARAEQFTLKANAAYALVLGPEVDPALLVPLVRMTVDFIAHQNPAMAVSGAPGDQPAG